jgi:predicted small lipoprotein YifL
MTIEMKARMIMRLMAVVLTLASFTMTGCGKNNPVTPPKTDVDTTGKHTGTDTTGKNPGKDTTSTVVTTSANVNACDFDTKTLEMTPVNSTFAIVDTLSTKCGRLTLKGGTYDCVVTNLDRPMDFTRNPAILTLRVLGPKKNVTARIKLTPVSSDGAPDAVFLETKSTKSGEWETLTFDFSGMKLESNWYKKVTIYFNVGKDYKTPGENWYFDDLMIPDDDLSPICLFKRADGQFPPKPKAGISWISNSTANPDIMSPSESIDGNWWLFIRGGDGTHGYLGVYTQKATSFNPLGPWTYYDGNPVIPYGFHGIEDSNTAIDPSPVMGKDGKLYMFYKGVNLTDSASVPSILLATSSDGFNYAKVNDVWLEGAGVADVAVSGDKYYLFVSRREYVFDNPSAGGSNATVYQDILNKGDGPANFDRYSINGQKICRLEGVDKWFMIYQGSPCHDDFPARFHVAISDDLIHWTKVANEKPLFSRGDRGSWDQGAIWAPAIIEKDGVLYMYYEGWGRTGYVENRETKYFTPGHSEIGIATCSKADFLTWCGLK